MRQQREKKREKEREREKKKRHPYGCTHPHAPLFYIPSRYIFVTVRSTSTVKKGAQFNDEKVCTLFSHCCSLLLSWKRRKKKKKYWKIFKKRRLKKQTPYRTRVVVRHTRTNNTTRKRERKSDARARERARERATGERRRCFLFFFARGDVSSIAFF